MRYELIYLCPDLALFDRITRSSDVALLRRIADKHVRDAKRSTYETAIYIVDSTNSAVVETLYDSRTAGVTC